ncbi:MAG: DUF1849 family protein [Alphaproteobacteria bacterium]|nr:DUF1849 family protein [Alphaproteobacteria bacterium]
MYTLKTINARLLIVFAVYIQACGFVAAQDIQPHTAIYEVRLGTAVGPDAPMGLSGTMVYVVEEACDGFNQVSNLDVTVLDRRGRRSNLRQTFTSFESADGRASTFDMKILSDERLVDAYDGRIDLEKSGGSMLYVREPGADDTNSEVKYDLDRDAQLSLTYTAEVVEKAIAGERFVSRVVADGLLEDGSHRISAVIGHRATAQPTVSDPDELLRGPPWPAQLAYYPVSSSSELPSQEMRVELYEGGIVGKID